MATAQQQTKNNTSHSLPYNIRYHHTACNSNNRECEPIIIVAWQSSWQPTNNNRICIVTGIAGSIGAATALEGEFGILNAQNQPLQACCNTIAIDIIPRREWRAKIIPFVGSAGIAVSFMTQA